MARACQAVCQDLMADRLPTPMDGQAAGALRHILRDHGLSGLASVAIEDGRLAVPAPARQGIRQDWIARMHHCLLLDQECAQIGRAVEAQLGGGLSRPLLLKGAAVAARYRNPSLRGYADIDLLVPVGEVRPWQRFLTSRGYRAVAPNVTAVEQRLQEGCAFTRYTDAAEFSVDLHTSVFVERRARELGYPILARSAGPSAFPGILQTAPEAQLLVLALHLAHHIRPDHRLIWYKDFCELGERDTVERARRFAEANQVEWALEGALRAVEEALGMPVWNASPTPAQHFGLARAHQLDRTGYLHHVALVRELGPLAGLRFLCTRIDPRRFVVPGRGFDWPTVRAWISNTARLARRTPWTEVVRRRR